MLDFEGKNLEECSKMIDKAFALRKQLLEEKHKDFVKKRDDAQEKYKSTGKTDARENAQLQEAIDEMQKANANLTKIERQIALFEKIEDLSRYNSVGIVVLYSTVKLELNGRTLIFKIYPEGISFIDDYIMAENSRLAVALMGKCVGDVVTIEHSSTGEFLEYKIIDIY